MNAKIWKFPVLAGVCTGLLMGCAHHHDVAVRTPDPVVVVQEPPPPRIETRVPAPAAGYSWTPGYWVWNGKRYVWHEGRWVRTPRTGAVWVEGHWERRNGGWAWDPGHWR